jgi:hypothetical protein
VRCRWMAVGPGDPEGLIVVDDVLGCSASVSSGWVTLETKGESLLRCCGV